MKSTTGQSVYNSALALLGEPAGNEGYAARAVSCINLLLAELSEFDSMLSGEAADLSAAVPRITAFADVLPLEDALAAALMPVGLAWLLLNEEETERADLFYRIYRRSKEEMRASRRRGRRHSIRSIY